MPSKRVQNRLNQFAPAVRVAFGCPEIVTEALRRQFYGGNAAGAKDLPIPGAEPSSICIGQLCIGIGRKIVRRGLRMLDADRTLDDARASQRRCQRRRDRLAKRLYREMVDLRRRVQAALGRERGARYMRFLGGPTSRDPVMLHSQASLAHCILTHAKTAPPVSPVAGIVHHWGLAPPRCAPWPTTSTRRSWTSASLGPG